MQFLRKREMENGEEERMRLDFQPQQYSSGDWNRNVDRRGQFPTNIHVSGNITNNKIQTLYERYKIVWFFLKNNQHFQKYFKIIIKIFSF